MKTFNETYVPTDSFVRVASACPEVQVADIATNVTNISALYHQAAGQDAALVVFPELSVTGYTLGDLVHQKQLLDRAEQGTLMLAEETAGTSTAMIVGLPLRVENGLYNCVAMLADGEIKGIVPKSHLPTYNEFYEGRWYETWDGPNSTVKIGEQDVPFGTDILFNVAGAQIGAEICEDVWVTKPPSIKLALNGAQIIANASASPEQVGKAPYRHDLVRIHSGQLIAGYVLAGCHSTESTADVVMGGHQIIAANGVVQAERKPFGSENLLVTDIDIDHIDHDRRRQHMACQIGVLTVRTAIARSQEDLRNLVDKSPFLPSGESNAQKAERLDMALNIQAYGLAMRMKATRQKRLVLGLSGGLDSTLALLVAHKAAGILGKSPATMIHTLTMPGPASSEGTQDNAQLLAGQLGVSNEVIPIGRQAQVELDALGHDGITQDITYENVQARARTSLLFDNANMKGGMVLGTGDLSEIALGWCTYNGDQQSHYNVNASIPKTLVKHLVKHVSEKPEFQAAKQTLQDILDTVVSPELTQAGNGEISQSTEDIIGPYALHDFFLYHLVRWGDSPGKIKFLAEKAFAGDYESDEISKWFSVFVNRFARNQFKRENMPNGPKVGSVSLSPRGDWRMPPDLYNAALWES